MIDGRVRRRLHAMQGLIEPAQGERLAALAAEVPEAHAIVELGSHTGLSTCWMAHAARVPVVAVDPWGPPRPGSQDDPFGLGDRAFERFAANVAAEGLASRVTPLAARSTDVAPLWRKPIGLLFVDANHEEWAVREDVTAWAPHVAVGGWIALHDHVEDPEHPYYGVAVVARELVASGFWDAAPPVGSLWTARRAA